MFVIPVLSIPTIFSIFISFSFVFIMFNSCPSNKSLFRLNPFFAIIAISFVSAFANFMSSGSAFFSC